MADEQLHSDMELEREIEEQLSWDYRLDSSNIQIHVTDGKVLLTGTVPSDTIRVLVTRNVAAIPGVLDVSDQLAVGEPARENIHEDLESKLTLMLKAAKDIDTSHIAVLVVEEGVVMLEGTTDTYLEKKRIEDIVASYIGTVGIENRIRIEPQREVADEAIAQNISTNILSNCIVNPDTIDIKVDSGWATLTGTVPTWTAYNSIYEAVASTYGVTHINLNIDIEETF
jgi:osmotically-inducible protein OsmY